VRLPNLIVGRVDDAVDIRIRAGAAGDCRTLRVAPHGVVGGIDEPIAVEIAANPVHILSGGDVVGVQFVIDGLAAEGCVLIEPIADVHHARVRVVAGPARMIEPDSSVTELVQEQPFEVVAVVE